MEDIYKVFVHSRLQSRFINGWVNKWIKNAAKEQVYAWKNEMN